MIRLIQRRLIVPRGDTGTFSIPVLAGKDTGDASVFTIFNPLTHRKIFEKVMQLSDGVLTMDLSHGDTVNLPVGQFVWDIKFYTNPTIADGHLVDGEEVDSYYAAFTLPVCEIRETGDNLLFSDEAPQATLSPGQVDYITASINEVTASKNAAAGSATEADTSATNAGLSASAAAISEQAAQDSQVAALASQQAAQAAATQAVEAAAQIEADLETKANVADLATVATSGSYNDLLNKPEGLATTQYVDEKTEKIVAHFPINLRAGMNSQSLTCSYTIEELSTLYSAGKTIIGSLDMIVPIDNEDTIVQSILMTCSIQASEGLDTIVFKTDGFAREMDLTLLIEGYRENNQDKWRFIEQVGLTAYITNLSGAPTLEFDAIDGRIINLETPVNDTDAATKGYVDNKVAAFTETDPTVPEWAKQAQKPTYTAQEVGAPTIQQMNEGLAQKAESLFVELMYNAEDDTITANKTIEEILNAYDAGKIVSAFLILDNQGQIPINITVSKSAMIAIYGHAIAMGSTIMIMGMNRQNVDNWAIFITESLQTDPVFSLQETSTGPYQAQNKKIENLANPTNDKDAANKQYVDNKIAAFTETDPTVPAWAKASTKPAYTAAEVGAPTVQEMNSAISTAIGNVNSFDMAVVQTLPTQNINTHTIYLVPKTGETNDVYDEYIYINNAWEMIGNTQIDLSNKADKADTVLETTLSRGRKDNTTVGGASLAFGINTEASGYYSVALGLDTTASSQGAFAEGKNTVAHYIAHAEGEDTQALGQWAHSQGVGTVAKGAASFTGGDHTIANGHASFVTGRYNAADSYDNWPTWVANTSYEVGDRIKRNLMVQNQPTDVGYHCTVANSDATFDNAHWELDGYHMNYVEIVGNGKEYEDPETHQMVRAGSNAYALEWNGTAHYMGNIYVGANADSTGGTKVLCEADFATDLEIQNIINGGAGA